MWRRTLMANERTYSAWVRTVLSLMAVALALPRLITAGTHVWIVRIVAIIFILVAGSLFIFASLTFSETDKRLRAEDLITAPRWFFWALTISLLVCIALSLLLVL